MSLKGIAITEWVGYIQAIIWFVLAGYLLYLTLKTKLTHVDKFRKNFAIAIIILIGSVTIYMVFRNFFNFSEQFFQILISLLLVNLFIFIIIMIVGYSTLIDYVSEIIEFENKNNKAKAFLISVVLDISSLITSLSLKIIDYPLLELIIGRVLFTGFFFSTFYTLFLHQEMKNANINVMIYFGFGFLSFAVMDFVAIFLNIMMDVLGWILINFTFIVMLILFISGYTSFKRRIG